MQLFILPFQLVVQETDPRGGEPQARGLKDIPKAEGPAAVVRYLF